MRYLIITISIATLVVILVSWYVRSKLGKMDKAKADSEFIMNNLNKPGILDRFPEKYFPRPQSQAYLDTLIKHCDFDTKRGKFVDYYTMSINGASRTAFIYEYFLNCDSIRFIYTYDFDAREPELQSFHFEGLEVKSNMIIDLSKQLLNSQGK